MKKIILVIALALLSVCSVRAESWSVVAGSDIGKIEMTQIEGKTYADVQALLSFLGYTVSINTEGKVIAISGGKGIAVENQPTPEDQFNTALQSLKDIASVARLGMNPADYSRMVSDSKISIDRLADKLGAENPNVKSLRAVLDIYLDGDNLWQEFKKSHNPFGNADYLSKNDEVVEGLLDKYPDLKDKLEKKFLTKMLGLSKGLGFFWDMAQVKIAEIKWVPDTVSAVPGTADAVAK